MNPLILMLVLVFGAGLVMLVIKALVGPRRQKARIAGMERVGHGPPPYVLRPEGLLTTAERGFFGALEMAAAKAGEQTGVPLRVFAKVRLADLMKTPAGTERWQTWQNMIQQKHVDFLVCRGVDLRPVAALELDDASHQRGGRGERDAFVDEAFRAAGLPLRRERVVGPGRGYEVEVLARGLVGLLGGEARARG